MKQHDNHVNRWHCDLARRASAMLPAWHDKTLAMLERRWRRRELIGRIIFDWVIPIICAAILAALFYSIA